MKILRRIIYILCFILSGFIFAFVILISPFDYMLTGKFHTLDWFFNDIEPWLERIKPDK